MLTLAAVCVLGLAAASCGGANAGGSAQTGIHAGGGTIPSTTSPAARPNPTLTTVNGAPKVVQFAAPRRFWCLPAHPEQAQVTVGWSVPSATHFVVLLDGRPVHSGIRGPLPFSVAAGPPGSGIGTTVVFPCRPDNRHQVAVRRRRDGSPQAERTVTITKMTHR